MYLTIEEYSGEIPENEAEEYLQKACYVIDYLTFNRIVKRGFDNLTSFQKSLIKAAAKSQAEFVYNNAELLESPLSAYSISGISMTFDRSKVRQIGNITTTSEVYGLLVQTGLCYRGL